VVSEEGQLSIQKSKIQNLDGGRAPKPKQKLFVGSENYVHTFFEENKN
jgi:hypothetical protein